MRWVGWATSGGLVVAAVLCVGCGEGDGGSGEPTVEVTAADPVVSEPDGTTVFSFTRVGGDTASGLEVTVSVSGTYEAGDCFVAGLVGDTVTFAPADTEALIAVYALDDFDFDDETVSMTVEPGIGYSVGASSSATVSLSDDDPFALVASAAYDEIQPVWSPDSMRIAYLAYPSGAPPGEIRVVNANVTGTTTVYGYANRCLDWNGDYILFTKAGDALDTGDGEIWKIRYDGTDLTRLTFTQSNGVRTVFSNPSYETDDGTALHGRFSPDGSLIVFNAHDGNGWPDTFVCNANGTDGWVRVEDSAYSARSTWAPDGAKVLFRFGANYNQPHGLRTCTWPDQATYATLVSGLPSAPAFAYSLDGTKIAYISGTDSDYNLSVMSSDGAGQTDLLSDVYNDRFGGGADRFWSPDGLRIVFDSDRTGNRDIHVINADGTALTPVTGSEGDNYDVSWSPDGSTLLFVTDRNADLDIVVMPAP